MENLWAPWRIDYILGRKPEGCIFCDKPAENMDEDNYILYRGKYHFIILNAFPYNNGHMMVVPYRHTATLSAWAPEEQQEMMQLADLCVELLRKSVRPDGFNLGINMGLVGGAGVADHIHLHIVPRWNGDTNFMPVLSDTRVISEALQATYKKLKGALDGLIETEKRQHWEEKGQKMEQKYNAIGWFEIPVTDMERAIMFYEQVFDFKLSRQQVGPLEMAWFPWVGTGLGATGSLVYSKEFYKPSREGVLVYFTAHSGDLAVELSRVEAAGGEVLVPKKLIRKDIGYMAVVLDSEGNRIALHSSS